MPTKIYTDGSYQESINPNVFGWGFVIYDENDIMQESDSGTDSRNVESRQIGGECEAVIKSLEYCLEHSITDIEIYHDYIGVGKWAEFEFRANKPVSQYYVQRYLLIKAKLLALSKELNQPFEIKFIKVKGHSNVEGNELADKLACNAIK